MYNKCADPCGSYWDINKEYIVNVKLLSTVVNAFFLYFPLLAMNQNLHH